MPVEIRELVIRAITQLDANKNVNQPDAPAASVDTEAIVRECVRQVMSILKKKEER